LGNVGFRRGAQLIMVDDRQKNRRAEENTGSKEDFPAAVHEFDDIFPQRHCPALIIELYSSEPSNDPVHLHVVSTREPVAARMGMRETVRQPTRLDCFQGWSWK
jgi:hypothetical protein